MNPAEIVQALRTALAGSDIREIKMFGGTCFMLNGNMLAGTFRNGLLARVGTGAQAEALAQPGASIMEMRGRTGDALHAAAGITGHRRIVIRSSFDGCGELSNICSETIGTRVRRRD